MRRRIHALRPGTFPASPHDLTLTEADIAAIAAAYNPERYRAPAVIGHPEDDHPAWGWIASAQSIDGDLWLDVDLLPEMDALIREQRYSAVSVSLWSPAYLGNPTPGVYALRHLGFLGAQPPAVKGLAPIRYDAAAVDGGAIDVVLTSTEPSMSQTPPAGAPSVDLAERETALKAREAQIAARERELRRKGFASEFRDHVAAARISAADVPSLVELADRLTDAPVVSLSDGERPAIDLLREFVSGLPARVDLSERAPGGAPPAVRLPSVPHGYRLSEAGLALHTRAVAYQEAHPGVDYIAAVRAVQSQS